MDYKNAILSVSELTRHIKGTLERGFTNISVQGEISNCKRHSSGHLYFTLKDENSQVAAVMWRSRAETLFFTPHDGMKVIARSEEHTSELQSPYDLVCRLLLEKKKQKKS